MNKNIPTQLPRITGAPKTPAISAPRPAAPTTPPIYEPTRLPHVPLTSMDDSGIITSLSPALEPRTFRRLEDLGFTPGEKIRKMMTSAFGGCAAYIIKGSVIVLRDSTSSQIMVNIDNPNDKIQTQARQTGGEKN